jgi:hypothetical protein
MIHGTAIGETMMPENKLSKRNLRRDREYAPMKPSTQEVAATLVETMRLFFKLPKMPVSKTRVRYQRSVNPLQGRLENLSTLKEKMMIVTMGRKRNTNTAAI